MYMAAFVVIIFSHSTSVSTHSYRNFLRNNEALYEVPTYKDDRDRSYSNNNEMFELLWDITHGDYVAKSSTNADVVKRSELYKEYPCQPREVLVSTYTKSRGIQKPHYVKVKQCNGGEKNPEAFQCQPSGPETIKCIPTIDSHNKDFYLGVFVHHQCEERCVCGVGECQNKKPKNKFCPVGTEVGKGSCDCKPISSIIHPSIHWHQKVEFDASEECRNYVKQNQLKDRITFELQKAETDVNYIRLR